MTIYFQPALQQIVLTLSRCLPLAFLLIADTSLGDWTTVPDIRLTAETDDNPRLRPEGREDNASRATLDARLSLENVGDRGNLYLEPRIRASSYSEPDDEVLEDEEYFLRSRGRYDWQAASIGFSAFASQQNIRNAEFRSSDLIDPDILDPTDPGTGLGELLGGDRESAWATPYLELHISDRNSALLQVSHIGVNYTGPASITRSDYDQSSASLGIIRRVGEITRVTARAFVAEFTSDRNNNLTDTIGIEGEFVQPLGASWTLNVTAGVQRSDFMFEVEDEIINNADTSLTLLFGLRRRADRTRINFDIGRSIYPSGWGYISEVTQARFWADRQFSQRVSGILGFRYERSKTLDQLTTLSDRNYARLDLRINWALTPRWILMAGYDLTNQKFLNLQDREGRSNSIFLGISFRGLPRQ